MIDIRGLEPKIAVDYLLATYKENAAKEFLGIVEDLDAIFADEIIMYLNDTLVDIGIEIIRCKFCGLYSLWEGYEDHPTFWSCEDCGDCFCDNCCHIDNENEEVVLCKDCNIKEENKC